MLAIGTFDDFSEFVESISCEISKTCQVPVVRIHAGEPSHGINNLHESHQLFVRLLYRRLQVVRSNSLTLLSKQAEHGFENWIPKIESVQNREVKSSSTATHRTNVAVFENKASDLSCQPSTLQGEHGTYYLNL